jgi:hypothetical protein
MRPRWLATADHKQRSIYEDEVAHDHNADLIKGLTILATASNDQM